MSVNESLQPLLFCDDLMMSANTVDMLGAAEAFVDMETRLAQTGESDTLTVAGTTEITIVDQPETSVIDLNPHTSSELTHLTSFIARAIAEEGSEDSFSRNGLELTRLYASIGATTFELCRLLQVEPQSAMEIGSAIVAQARDLNPRSLRALHKTLNGLVEAFSSTVSIVDEEEKVRTTDPLLQQPVPNVINIYDHNLRTQRGPEYQKAKKQALRNSPWRDVELTESDERLFIPNKSELTNHELFEQVVPGNTPEDKINHLTCLAEQAFNGLDRNRSADNMHRAIVLLLRSCEAVKGLPSQQAPELHRWTDRAVSKFVTGMRGYIGKVVSNIQNKSELKQDDLIAEGTIGLLDALRRFDLYREVKVISFCSARIKGAAVDAIRNTGNMIHISRSDIEVANKVHKIMNQEGKGLREAAKKMDVDAKDIADILDRLALRQVVLAEGIILPNSEHSIMILVRDETVDVEEDVLCRLERSEIAMAIDQLKPNLQNFLRMRFGYPPYDGPLTLQDIADSQGYTESRACQIQKEAIYRLNNLLSPDIKSRHVKNRHGAINRRGPLK